MRHSNFQIGTEFYTGTGKWRCTDAGTRAIVAISLELTETVRVTYPKGGCSQEEQFVSDSASPFIGPLYAVAEHVFAGR